MSIKRKMATALATAGLLAGIFGSTLAPVAQAATVKGNVLRDELRYNQDGGYNGGYHTGTASDPFVMYAPLSNDGTSYDSIGNDDDPICFSADESYLQTTGGAALHDDGDEVGVKVAATNGLGIYFYDSSDSSSYSSDESDWTTGSKTIDDISGGIFLCLAPMDDDDAYTSTVTVTVRGQLAWSFTVVVAGPATSITPVSLIGGWVAESNDEIGAAAALSFKDKAGQSLKTYLKTIGGNASWLDDVVDYAKTGYTSNPTHGDLVFYVDDVAVGDAESDLAFDNSVVSGGLVGLSAGFCGAMDETHSVKASINVDGSENADNNATLSNADLSSPAWSYKCSGDGSEAVWSGLAFDQTSVEQGDIASAHFSISDGHGHPMGTGSSYSIYTSCEEIYDYNTAIDQDSSCVYHFPREGAKDSGDGEYYADTFGADLGFDWGNATPSEQVIADGEIADDEGDFAEYLVDGNVQLWYRASMISTGVASVRIAMCSNVAYESDMASCDSVETFKASIAVLPAGQHSGDGALFGTTIKVGKRTVSITGPVGAKVTFVVEDGKMNIKQYYRVVGADGKAALRFRVKGSFKVTALLGDLISNTAYISPKF